MHILYNNIKGALIMTDYKKMYREMFIAATKAIEILIDAQQKCEEIYISAEEKENIIRIVKKIKAETD